MKTETKEYKANDVFSFRYNAEELKKRFEPYHCFDGTLVVKDCNGETLLVDTYWSGAEGKWLTIKQAQEQGDLAFLCNLDEMQEIKEYETVYYNDEDVVILRIHAGHRNRFLIKTGTGRSKSKMLDSIKVKIEEEEYKIKSAESSIRRLKETLTKIEGGDLSVYL